MNLWQWFLAHGDKLLTGVAVTLTALVSKGVIPADANWLPVVTGLLAVGHTLFLPEPAAPGQSTGAPKP